jgi:adenosine deaminase
MTRMETNLPLIDLHRHLEGSVRLATILDLGRKHNLPLPAWDIESLRPYIQVMDPQPGVMAFIAKFDWVIKVLADYESCRRIAYESIQDAWKEGIDYLELRFSPWFMAEAHELDPGGIVEAVIDGVSEGSRETGLQVGLIGILSRTYGPTSAWNELQALLGYSDRLKGLDLAGDEANYPGELFENHIRKARDLGLKITVHAGESAGPESIWQAIQGSGANRIGHAVRAVDDPELLKYMADNQIGIEANLTSNVQTSTVSSYSDHPLKYFLEQGLLATINTDDPKISGIDLAYEYEVAAPAAGLTPRQIRQAQGNALVTSFLTEDEKEALLAQKSGAGPAS